MPLRKKYFQPKKNYMNNMMDFPSKICWKILTASRENALITIGFMYKRAKEDYFGNF